MKLTPWMLSLTGFCIVIALTGGFVVKQMRADGPDLRQTTGQPVRFASTETVPVALSDILPGTRIEASYLTQAPILTTNVRKHRDTVRSAKSLIGRIAKHKISGATPIRLSMLYPVDRKPNIRIPPGQRLVSVGIEEQSGFINGLIQSGSYVDVFATLNSESTTNGVQVVQLFEGVRVYEVFSPTGAAGGRTEAVIELTPDQQKVMLLAKERGRISLTYNPEGPGTGGLAADSMAANNFLRNNANEAQSSTRNQHQNSTPSTHDTPSFVTEQFRNGVRSHAMYDHAGSRLQPPMTAPMPGHSTNFNAARDSAQSLIGEQRIQ